MFTMGPRVFNDMVHGHMEFHPLIVNIIDTPQFQRLRSIKQTGPCVFVYPGAVHTRFEHSLGTAFLAGKLMDALNEKRDKEIRNEEKREMLCVQIAGLCHDLGHGPFSHLWENFLKRCKITWKHENASVQIFDLILKEKTWDSEKGDFVTVLELFRRYKIDGYIDMIKDMIYGKDEILPGKMYLYQVISNKQNSVDVDKWDYLMRDSKMTNVPISFDCNRLLSFCRILETVPGTEEICFRDKEYSTLFSMFVTRGLLHEKVYQHKKVKIIEEMLIDAFTLAKDRLNLTSTDPCDLLKLTDHIFELILYGNFGDDENIYKSRKVLQRLLRRDLYLIIAAYEVPMSSHNISDRTVSIIPEREEILRLFVKNLKALNCLEDENLFACTAISITPPKVTLTGSPLDSIKKYTKQGKLVSDYECHCLMPETYLRREQILILYKGSNLQEYCYSYLLEKIVHQYSFIKQE